MEVVSLFSGCGGTDLGFQNAGHDLIWSNDIDKWACASYEANLGIKPISGDISKVNAFPHADILVGCYPCQGFSLYGTRRYNDPRNFLYLQFLRALEQTKPKFFLTENVKGLLFGFGQVIFKDMLKKFKSKGYKLGWRLIDAANYGVPQNRERVIIVGRRADYIRDYEFPAPTHGNNLRPIVTMRDAIGDMPSPKADEVADYKFSSHYMSRNRKRRWNEPSFTIQASGQHAPLYPSGGQMAYVKKDVYRFGREPNRRMSYKECAVLQSFPVNFKFEGSLNNRYKQIGNAVPPLLAKLFAESFD